MAVPAAEAVPTAAAATRRYRRFGLHNLRLGFRRWRRSRAFWGGFWSILGGAIILYMPTMAIKLLFASGTNVLVGILTGLLIVIFGLFLWFAPWLRHIVGVVIVLLALASLITADLGGFLLGMLLAMTGGALGFAWVPTEPRLKRWRIRRLLHLPIPAVQPDLELRGLGPEDGAATASAATAPAAAQIHEADRDRQPYAVPVQQAAVAPPRATAEPSSDDAPQAAVEDAVGALTPAPTKARSGTDTEPAGATRPGGEMAGGEAAKTPAA
ncbi:MAG TPA: DUF6114 domain-containing protein [Candidatus Binatia bacterium]|nr:DUF6114 domain-containing protein [Candidatus Binatia bacterium]